MHVGGAALHGRVGRAVVRARAPVGIRRASCIGPSHCGGLPACAGSARHVENSCCGRQCHVRRAIGARRRVGGSAVPTVGRQSLSVGVASAPGGRAAGAACRVASCKCVAVRFLSCTAWSSGVGGEARAPPEALERGACATGRRASREKSTCTRRNARSILSRTIVPQARWRISHGEVRRGARGRLGRGRKRRGRVVGDQGPRSPPDFAPRFEDLTGAKCVRGRTKSNLVGPIWIFC